MSGHVRGDVVRHDRRLSDGDAQDFLHKLADQQDPNSRPRAYANPGLAPGVEIGAYALVGIGAVVLRDVPAHALVLGNPARAVGWVCRCAGTLDDRLLCPRCDRSYVAADLLTEIQPGR